MGDCKVKTFGQRYAAAYDAMYKDKNYTGECDELEWGFKEFAQFPIKSVLDVGCGTGRHSWELARRGFNVMGVDRSPEMVAIANNNSTVSVPGSSPVFSEGDAVSFKLDRKFDAAIMMFAVICYLNTNELLIGGLKNVADHIRVGGLFFADFWYGPGVLLDSPTERTHKRDIGDSQVQRRVVPQMNYSQNTCALKYEITETIGGHEQQVTHEEHVMRYLFGPELELALSLAGMKLLHLGQSSDWSSQLQGADWTGSLVARRV